MKTITPEKLAKKWKISAGTLANWRYKNKGPKFIKTPKGTVVYKIEDVEKYEKQIGLN